MLVIADAERAVAVGGVMGGATRKSGRDDAHRARERLLHARVGPAHEQAPGAQDRGVHALRARRRLQWGPGAASRRASALLQQIGAGTAEALIDVTRRQAPLEIRAAGQRASRACSGCVPRAESRGFSTPLGFVAEAMTAEPGWLVTVPTFRVDVTREVDLIEEVGRHYGFDKPADDVPGR
jgi:phenylalanyl-tRNA synthetase beta chain